ncbi:MAG TPA: SDR family oxidoreductase [Anaerolineae bacterium]|nr:SDR family oxidoreductase [Anaerolineae bacterium]
MAQCTASWSRSGPLTTAATTAQCFSCKGSRNLGPVILGRLAACGAAIALNCLPSDQEDGRKVAEELGATGCEIEVFPADVSKGAEVPGMGEALLRRFGHIDILVHCAGRWSDTSFVADQHPEIHRELLPTAAILHDVGKATSYTLGPVLDVTDEGRLIDHVVQGALVVQTAIEGIEGFPQGLRNRLLHAILAHHGALERGSPVAPKTLEALAVHHADWTDGDIRGFLDAL